MNQQLDAEIREDNRIVSDWLLYYHERRRAYYDRRENILHSTPRPDVGGGRSSAISDTTGGKGSKLGDMETVERWIELAEEVERRLPWKMRAFLLLRREYRHVKGNKGWTTAVQWRFAHEVAERLGKRPEDTWIESRRTFTRWWNRIVEYTARLAAKRGLL